MYLSQGRVHGRGYYRIVRLYYRKEVFLIFVFWFFKSLIVDSGFHLHQIEIPFYLVFLCLCTGHGQCFIPNNVFLYTCSQKSLRCVSNQDHRPLKTHFVPKPVLWPLYNTITHKPADCLDVVAAVLNVCVRI